MPPSFIKSWLDERMAIPLDYFLKFVDIVMSDTFDEVSEAETPLQRDPGPQRQPPFAKSPTPKQ